MNSLPGRKSLPDLLPLGAEVVVRSDSELDVRVSGRSNMSKPDSCCSGLETQTALISKLSEKGISITEASLHTTACHKQGEHISSPLRLALARRSVKNKIFTYMDHGDRKKDIESRTGLSHRCIKWHRRLWRNEGSHPRVQSKKVFNGSARHLRSPDTRSEGSARIPPACDDKGESSIADESGTGKRLRKHRAVRRSKGRFMRRRTEMPGSGGGCTDGEESVSDCLAGKENDSQEGEAMAMSGELKILLIRDLRP